MFKGTLTIRPARCNPASGFDEPENADIRNICSLLGGYAKEKLLLPRTHEDVRRKSPISGSQNWMENSLDA